MSTKQNKLNYTRAAAQYYTDHRGEVGLAPFPDESTWTAQHDTAAAERRIASTAGRPLLERADAAEREIQRAIRYLHEQENQRRQEIGEDAISLEAFKADQAQTIADGDAHLIADDIESVSPGAVAALHQAHADYQAALAAGHDQVAERLSGILGGYPGSQRFASTVQDALGRAALLGEDAPNVVLDRLAQADPQAFVAHVSDDVFSDTLARLAEAEQTAAKVNPYDNLTTDELDAAIRQALPNPGAQAETSSDAAMFQLIQESGVSAETTAEGYAALQADVAAMKAADTPATPAADFSHLFKTGA